MAIPVPLPPAIDGLDVTVTQVESLRHDISVPLEGGGKVIRYRDVLDGTAKVILQTTDAEPVAMRDGQQIYLGGWLDERTLDQFVSGLCGEAGIDVLPMPEGVRTRTTGGERFWFNYSDADVACHGVELPAAGVLRVPV